MIHHLACRALLIGGLVCLLPVTVQAGGAKQDLPPRVKMAQDLVTKYLTSIGGNRPGQVTWLGDKAVQETFPKLVLFSVRYRQFPVAFQPPKGLMSSNVLAVSPNGKIQPIIETKQLPQFVGENCQGLKVDEKKAEQVIRTWLILHQELVQDGFYAFEAVKVEAKKGAGNVIKAEGRSMITKGGNGEITVTIDFAPDGSMKAGQEHKIRPGPRPKCQATKLLDPDSIVRYMAETELLYMGLAARPYLLEQRALANPALRVAIDRLLKKIEAEGW